MTPNLASGTLPPRGKAVDPQSRRQKWSQFFGPQICHAYNRDGLPWEPSYNFEAPDQDLKNIDIDQLLDLL